MTLDKSKHGWWKDAVFYQIYPKSFRDTTGNGIGDLQGVIAGLDHLQELGVDGIWLSPVCCSPQVDNGYDISDYCDIDPMFGSIEDMEELIRQAESRGISIILDLVLNHSSDQHPWFLEARKSRNNPYHHYYIWRDGNGTKEPNDIRSVFGGSAWTYIPELGQYYFHQFAPEQPDLNWENPDLRKALYKTILFWVKKGIKGFRLDVIDQIAKEPDRHITINGPKLHDYLQELSREAFFDKSLVTVGEAWGADVDRAALYSKEDGSELSMVFQFEHMGLDQEPGGPKWHFRPLRLTDLKHCYCRWQQGLHGRGWNSLFLNNHDLPRILSRWGDPVRYPVESAKMLATMLYGMEGTPYIYQGEEIGMTNIRLPIEAYVDLEIHNYYKECISRGENPQEVMERIYSRGRDNARTPMQWTAGKNGGFTTGKPWLPVNENYIQINAESQYGRTDSVFAYYQMLIRLRKEYSIFRNGWFSLVDEGNEKVFAYRRDTDGEHLLVVCSFAEEFVEFSPPADFVRGRKLIGNYKEVGAHLRPYEAYMLFYDERSPEE